MQHFEMEGRSQRNRRFKGPKRCRSLLHLLAAFAIGFVVSAFLGFAFFSRKIAVPPSPVSSRLSQNSTGQNGEAVDSGLSGVPAAMANESVGPFSHVCDFNPAWYGTLSYAHDGLNTARVYTYGMPTMPSFQIMCAEVAAGRYFAGVYKFYMFHREEHFQSDTRVQEFLESVDKSKSGTEKYDASLGPNFSGDLNVHALLVHKHEGFDSGKKVSGATHGRIDSSDATLTKSETISYNHVFLTVSLLERSKFAITAKYAEMWSLAKSQIMVASSTFFKTALMTEVLYKSGEFIRTSAALGTSFSITATTKSDISSHALKQALDSCLNSGTKKCIENAYGFVDMPILASVASGKSESCAERNLEECIGSQSGSSGKNTSKLVTVTVIQRGRSHYVPLKSHITGVPIIFNTMPWSPSEKAVMTDIYWRAIANFGINVLSHNSVGPSGLDACSNQCNPFYTCVETRHLKGPPWCLFDPDLATLSKYRKVVEDKENSFISLNTELVKTKVELTSRVKNLEAEVAATKSMIDACDSKSNAIKVAKSSYQFLQWAGTKPDCNKYALDTNGGILKKGMTILAAQAKGLRDLDLPFW